MKPRVLLALTVVTLAGAATAHAAKSEALDCVIMPRATVDVSAAVPGRIASVDVDRSDVVEEGQIVAALDDGVERAGVELAQARAAIESEIRLREVGLRFDRRNLKRLKSLGERQAASTQAVDEASRDAAVARLNLERARLEQRLRDLELRRAEEVQRQKTVRTPIPGVVVKRFRAPGEYVENQPILRVAQLDPLHVEVITPMSLFGEVREGMQAQVTPETIGGSALRATVTAVDKMGDAASGTFGLRLELPNPEHKIPAGLRCSAVIQPQARVAGLAGGNAALSWPLGVDWPVAYYTPAAPLPKTR